MGIHPECEGKQHKTLILIIGNLINERITAGFRFALRISR